MAQETGDDTRQDGYRPQHATRLVFWVFLLTIGAGVVFSAAALARMGAPPRGSLRTGEWTAALEREFDRALPLYRPALYLWTALRFAAFAEGGPGLVVGTDDRLFTAEELETHPRDAERVEEAAAYITAVGHALAEREAALAVVLLPSKARIYEDMLPGYGLPRTVDRRYERAVAALRGERDPGTPKVTVVDPRGALRRARQRGTEVFLRTDTHWTPEGAAAVARAVAGEVEGLLGRRDVPRTRFERAAAETVTHRGDLLRFLPLGPFEAAIGPPADRLTRYETDAASGGSGDLFDDPAIPVTLVGTSYSADELWGFRGALAEALEADVLTVAAEGEGPFAPMEEYLRGETITDQPPELVIWEIPERYLAAGLPAAARGRLDE
ncbi:MAG: alginate O-acetyltransferase AlgX-related protein [Spirochaetaceae bacterium]